MLLNLSSPVFAADCDVYIKDISVNPIDADVGDLLKIDVDFRIDCGCCDPEVKLRLYIDGDLKESYTQYHSEGTHSHRFYLNTDSFKRGYHTLKIKAYVYDNGYTEDTDIKEKTFYLHSYTTNQIHDLSISRIEYTSKVEPLEKIAVKVTVENKGNNKENNVRVLIELDDATEQSNLFSLSAGQKKTTTIYIRSPEFQGSYKMKIKAYNYYDQETEVERIIVREPDEPETATETVQKETKEPAPEKEKTTESITVPDNLVAIIIVRGEDIETIYFDKPEDQELYNQTNETKEEPLPPKYKYITVDVSSKELDVVKGEGNFVKIIVSNHMGEEQLIKIETDFRYEWVFVPHAEVLDNEETKNFYVYFNPTTAGSYEGNIYVKKDDEVIKTIPLSLFIPTHEKIKKEHIGLIGSVEFSELLILMALLFFVVFFGISYKKLMGATRPLEVKSPLIAEGKTIKPKIRLPSAGIYNTANKYVVPWRNVVR